MQEPDSLEKKQAILEYWTLVEFFSPYPLENTLANKQHCQKIFADKSLNDTLVWQHREPISEHDPTSPFTKGYHLYLGIFSIEETADLARHTFAKEPSVWQSINWRSCMAASSISCFARLTVTTHGIPLFGTLTLSTLPWAHGRLLKEKKESLTIEQYWKNVHRLLQHLREEFSDELPLKLVKEPKQQARYLDMEALSKLVEILYAWAGYKPQGYPLLLIDDLSGDSLGEAKNPQIKSIRDVPILNSFYIQDLESAANSLNSLKGTPIDLYLGGNEQNRILLESDEGAKIILNMLKPEKIPSGRWPDPLTQQQSLMQQFAINAAFDSDIFSVNGPPGTGKTSLLREIVAENIVSRATKLSQFNKAQDAFIGTQTLNFENNDPLVVSELDPSLLGFEMLVVSSNNIAVQNLSQELPLRSQLDPSFQSISYLETVANKVFQGKEKEAWGLISATLGNIENCRHFVETVFMAPSENKGQSRIWEWIDDYDGPSFAEAKEAFIAIKARQTQLFDELKNLAWLHDEIDGHTVETYCRDALNSLRSTEEEFTRLTTKTTQLLQEEQESKELILLLQEKEALVKQERPNLIMRIKSLGAKQAWLEQYSLCKKERIAAMEELHKCKENLRNLRKLLQEQNEIEDTRVEELLNQAILFEAYQEAYLQLKQMHPTARLLKGTKELEETKCHIHSYYQTEAVNRVRSELFVAAMTLHEAWLRETSQIKGGFRGNLMAIANILQGKSPTTADDTRLAWQSVFMLVPVLSSTFASIGRLFRHLEPKTLGWVLIDEAGQSIPQAAVGAIWRAKRVLSIGDPFQIEPICTIPAEVIDGMAKSKINDYTLSWTPSQCSVQHLMDRTSRFGSKRTFREGNYWLGSPLRVHRRCQEPMFSIANTIAYDGNMLLATEHYTELPLPPSCWWDVGGDTSQRQYVPEQVDALVDLLHDVFKKMNDPDLYIISPFREVVSQIQQRLMEDKAFGRLFREKFLGISLPQWIQQAIGTVHTFQGKQAAIIFFVLGADKTTLGAIEWASRKPNLLNVAVTRAQSRFYIIGDYNLWKPWPYFDVAAKKLKRCSP